MLEGRGEREGLKEEKKYLFVNDVFAIFDTVFFRGRAIHRSFNNFSTTEKKKFQKLFKMYYKLLEFQ